MRALRSHRLLSPKGGAKGGKAGQAEAPKAPKRRRKPPPRWRRPALVSAALLLAVTLLSTGAYGLWRAGYPQAALGWLERGAQRLQVGTGLALREVTLWGREWTPRAELLAALEVRRGEPILSLDLASARARLEAIGWIESATVARRLPAFIEIRIVERKPLALWQRRGKLVLISDQGAVITAAGLERFRDLPIVVGEDAPDHAAALIEILNREPTLMARVEAAIRVGGRRWNLRFRSGLEVRLPEGAEAEAWRRLAGLERDHRILGRELVAIDLRLPDRLIVELVPGGVARYRDPGKKT